MKVLVKLHRNLEVAQLVQRLRSIIAFLELSLYQKKHFTLFISSVEQFQQIERIKTINHLCPSVLQRGELVAPSCFPQSPSRPDIFFFFSFFFFSFSLLEKSIFPREKWNQKCTPIPRDEESGNPSWNYFRPLFLRLTKERETNR